MVLLEARFYKWSNVKRPHRWSEQYGTMILLLVTLALFHILYWISICLSWLIYVKWKRLFTLVGGFISVWRKNIYRGCVTYRCIQKAETAYVTVFRVFVVLGSDIGSDTSFLFVKPFQANTAVLSEIRLRSLRALFFTSLLTNYFSFRLNVIGNTDGIVKILHKWMINKDKLGATCSMRWVLLNDYAILIG